MSVVPHTGTPGTNYERTFIAIKPDGVQRGKVGEIIGRFESKGYKLVAMKMCTPTKEKAEGHYADLAKKPFFPGLVKYFSSGPIVAMVWEGQNAILAGRMLLGATNPKDSLPGTIRGDLCIDVGRNICHGSDGPESAAHEIAYWFPEEEVASFTSHSHQWVYENGAPVKKTGGKGGDDKKAAKKEKKAPAKQQLSKKEQKKAAEAADAAKAFEKQKKACFKEGGKKGQDLAGMAAFGVHFFLTAMDEPKGNMDMLKLVMDGANKEVDPEGDDRKGGAGDLGKIFMSAGEKELAMYVHVPKECQEKLVMTEWVDAVCKDVPSPVITPIDEFFMKVTVDANPDKGHFPLKMRDAAIGAGFAFLRSKGLVMDDDSDDDINYADDCGIDLNAGGESDY